MGACMDFGQSYFQETSQCDLFPSLVPPDFEAIPDYVPLSHAPDSRFVAVYSAGRGVAVHAGRCVSWGSDDVLWNWVESRTRSSATLDPSLQWVLVLDQTQRRVWRARYADAIDFLVSPMAEIAPRFA